MGAAGIATGLLYQQQMGRSFLPYMGKPKVSRGAAEAGGVSEELGYDSESGPSGPQPTAGDRIEDKDGDGIPDNINLVSGTGDTFRTLGVSGGTFAQMAQRYEKEREEAKRRDQDLKTVSGVTNKLKDLVAKQAGRAIGIPDTRFDIATGRDVIAGGVKTGIPIMDFAQPIGQKAFEKFTLPKIEAAAAQAALGTEGYGVFTLGGGEAVALTPDGIVGDVDTFLDRTGRTRTQLENELRDKTSAGLGGGYLGDLYRSYTSTPVTPTTSFDEIKGRYMYEESIINSSLSDELKSTLLGGADLRPTIDYTFAYEDGTYGSGTTTGFSGRNRFDASTGQVITDNTPSGPYRDEYETGTTGSYFSSNMFDEGYSQFDIPSVADTTSTTTPTYTTTTTYTDYYDSSDSDSDSGYSAPSPGSDFGSYDSSYDSIFAEGGRVHMKKGGTSGDPIQGTGFVSGPPNQFTKSETVADTEYRQVRDGSFVLNAPTVERLQKLGMLPSRVDKPAKNTKIKAKEGGLIDVALSKGEVVIEPEDVKKFGGYDQLERINNQGKSEVDRRQSNMGGRVGFAEGGSIDPGLRGTVSAGSRGFLGLGRPQLELLGPSIQYQQPAEESFITTPPSSSSDGYTPFVPNLTPFEKLTADLLLRLEGNKAQGYVPKKTGKDLSGVSVGLGFDIGQHDVKDLERMGFNSALISKFTPYLNKIGDDARAILNIEPLELTADELAEVNQIALRSKIESFDSFFPEYKDVNDVDRAVLISADWIGGMRPTKKYPKGRYIKFKNKYEETLDMDKALTRGLLERITKGDAEYNRAKKAKDWLQQTRETFRRSNPVTGPTPRPN